MKRQSQVQRGMALVAALFLMVVLAALGIAALSLNATQQQAATLNVQQLRAQAAAQAGVQYCSYRVLNVNNCNACPATLAAAAFAGFSIRNQCTRSQHQVSGVNYWVYDLNATASYGNYGSADFVARTATRTVSNIP